MTNLVNRATARADELGDEEIRAGLPRLTATVSVAPAQVAVLGITAYRDRVRAPEGGDRPAAECLAGVPLWVLPNPSGLNAHYQQPALSSEYAKLAAAVR